MVMWRAPISKPRWEVMISRASATLSKLERGSPMPIKLPITAWRREREQLEQEYKEIQSELSPLHADAKKLWAIHYNIYEVQHEQARQNAATRQKRQEIEH